MEIADTAASVELPMERPLYTPTSKARIAPLPPEALLPDEESDASALFNQVVVDKARLARNVRHALQSHAQITLKEIAADYPLQHGLAELVAYLQLGESAFQTLIDDSVEEGLFWPGIDSEGHPVTRRARLPRVIFVRKGAAA